jgi:hypothetical protein
MKEKKWKEGCCGWRGQKSFLFFGCLVRILIRGISGATCFCLVVDEVLRLKRKESVAAAIYKGPYKGV